MPVSLTVPPHAVDRPELRARLDVGLDAPLTLVVAPAGSGKSVLLAQWAATLTDVRIAWLDMTRADDDAVRFARRLVSELGALDPALTEPDAGFGSPNAGLGEPLIEALAASLAEVPGKVVVIFDDLHNVSNGDVVTDLWRLVDQLPPNAHFVFSSRVDLKLGWSRHRLQHGLVEIRQAQLAFDAQSAARILEQIRRGPVDAATAEAVVERTEGWAAGIQLTGLSLRFRADADEVVDALAESDRLAIDYLSEEVLDAQSSERRRALLDLSVLDELSPGLVEAVAGVSDGATFLRDLEDESMFIVAVGGEPDRYRFHHLFRDLLRYRLRASEAHAEGRLLERAADWHLSEGNTGAAIESLLAARRWDRAIDLILTRGRDIYDRGETATGARWLSLVPSDVRRERVDAQILYAILEGMSGHAALAEDVLRAVLADPALPIGARVVARAYVAAVVQFRPHPEVYLADGREALEMLEDPAIEPLDLLHLTDRTMLTALASVSVGRAHLLMGSWTEAAANLRAGLEAEGGRYGPYRVHVLGSMALLEAWTGRLTAAAELADEALELARELDLLSHPAPADAYLARSLVAIQRGEPESGAFALHEGFVRAAANGRSQLMWIAHVASSLIDPDATDISAVTPAGSPPPLVKDALRAIAHRAQRLAGRTVTPGDERTLSPAVVEDIAGLIAARDLAPARARLDAVIAPSPLPTSSEIDLHLLRAWLAAADGAQSVSREHLNAAVALAEPEGLIHPFLRLGSEVIALVRALPGPPTPFRTAILERFSTARRAAPEQLVEPLTSRELELLAYLPSRLTNAELAARCFVSVNTVKTHMAHIYRKLDAAGRDAAIARARELGLLDADIARVG